METNSSTRARKPTTSAQKITERRSSLHTRLLDPRFQPVLEIPTTRRWRQGDPEPQTIAELTPRDLGKRVVIRSKEFIGTVYGSLLGVYPHPTLTGFTKVNLWQKKELTFRDDTEVMVLD